jgi:uncharacterized protein Yka (UPF0111/DUF47 family)
MASDQIIQKGDKRKPGAQPGNLNAFKHGYYSKIFTPLDREDIEKLLAMNLEDEILKLRYAAQQTFNLSREIEDVDQAVKVLGALGLAAIRTSRLLKSQKELGNGDQSYSVVRNVINEILRDWGRI